MDFILGEKKEVRIKITSVKNEPFYIRNPSYELIKKGLGGGLEDSGVCEIEDTEIKVLLQPKTVGYYTLKFKYEISEEILKANVSITVGDD